MRLKNICPGVLIRREQITAGLWRNSIVINEYGSLNLNSDEVTYTYKGENFQLSSHPYEPCLYIQKGDELICVLHNAYTTEQIAEAFIAGKKLKYYHNLEYDEAGFCRVLAAALDSGRDSMDFFYAATKLAKEGYC